MKKLTAFLLVCTVAIILGAQVHAATLTLGPSQDAGIADGLPGNQNMGAWEYFFPSWNQSLCSTCLGLIQFSLDAIPAYSTITNATLKVWHGANPQPEGTILNLYRINSAWSEGMVTYNSRPSWSAAVNASTTCWNDQNWVSCDITSMVQAWFAGAYANYGLVMAKSPNQYPWPCLSSKESAEVDKRPVLEIAYMPVPEPSSLLALGSGILALVGIVRRRRNG